VNRRPTLFLLVAAVAAVASGTADADAADDAKAALEASLVRHPPGNWNVFAGDDPARVDLRVIAPGPEPRDLSAAWTLTDIDGASAEGKAAIRTKPGEAVVAGLDVGAEAFGPYTLAVRLTDGEETLATLDTRLARLLPQPKGPRPDSPFGVRAGGNERLLALAVATGRDVTATVRDRQAGAESFARTSQRAWNRAKLRDKFALAVAWTRSVKGLKTLADQGNAPVTDAAAIQHLPVATLRFEDALLPNEPEGRIEAVRALLKARDDHFPGMPTWTMDGWWQAKDPLGPEGARMLPRVVLSQLAAGVDRVVWDGSPRDGRPGVPLIAGGQPTPAYAAFATMQAMLDGARYVGPTGVEPRIQQHWFVRGSDVVLAAWHIGGQREVTFSSTLNRIAVTDHVGRRRTVEPRHGYFDLTLTPEVQYVRFPRERERYGAAGIRMLTWMEELRVFDRDALPTAIEQAADEAHTSGRAMTRLRRLIRLAEQIAHKGEAPDSLSDDPTADGAARRARQAVEEKEGESGYLRRARVALAWTERLAREVDRQGPVYGPPLAWAARLAADATRTLAEHETPFRLEAADDKPKPKG